MIDLKNLDDKIDYESLKPIGWDLVIRDKNIDDDGIDVITNVPWDVYNISDYYHTESSHHGLVSYWCCPATHKPTKDSLTPYNGPHGGVRWGIHVEESLHYRNKWSSQSWEESYICYILRNDKKFYEICGRTMSYLLAKAQYTLIQLQEHSIPFHFRNWRKELIGRTVFYKDEPGIITDYHHGTVTIEPDGINFFKKPAWVDKDDYYESHETNAIVDILDNSIFWYRETWADKKIAQEEQDDEDQKMKEVWVREKLAKEQHDGETFTDEVGQVHSNNMTQDEELGVGTYADEDEQRMKFADSPKDDESVIGRAKEIAEEAAKRIKTREEQRNYHSELEGKCGKLCCADKK